jgi:hypothetical protein
MGHRNKESQIQVFKSFFTSWTEQQQI